MKANLRTVILSVIILFPFSQLCAKNLELTQTIRGKVIDQDSKFPLPGANVIILNSNPVLGSSTDLNGKFVIKNVSIGRHSIKISFIGYKPVIIPNILIGSGKETILNIKLTEEPISTETVVITPDVNKENPINDMASISARSFSVEETSRYAASINDPARMAMSFAGVSNAGSDAMNNIAIRGNSPNGMLWFIDGVPVINPNHFATEGSTGGAISMISNNMLDNSDFYSGAWQAGFGNALSGIFDINFRQGNANNYENAFQIGALGVDFSSEGPLPFFENASYLVNYRYSTLSLFDAVGIQIIEKSKGLPDFQDLSFKLFLPTKKFGVFSIWGIGGLSNAVSESILDTGYTYDGKKYIFFGEEGEQSSSDIGIVGITNMYFINKKSYFKTMLSYSGINLKNDEEEIFDNEVKKSIINEFTNNRFVLSLLYNNKINANTTFQLGLISDYGKYFSKSLEYKEETSQYSEMVNSSGTTNLSQGFFQLKHKLKANLTLFAGLHSSYFWFNKKYTAEPRVALKWQLTDKGSISVGAGFHSKLQSSSLYLMNYKNNDGTTSQINKNLDFSKAKHYVISYDDMFFDNWRIKLEAYYQGLYSMPIAKDTIDANNGSGYLKTFSEINRGSTITYTALDNKGTGTNYGIELTIERFFNNGWYFMSTNSLYKAKYKGFDGIERNSRYNGNFTINLLAGKEFYFGTNKTLGLNTRIISAGGQRDYPRLSPRVLLDESGNPVIDEITGEEALYAPKDYDNAFAEQFDNYFRIDLGISFRLDYSKVAHIFSIDIQNATNNKNIRKIDYYDENSKQYVYKYQAGIIPAFKYRIEF
jgi:CarboxypepD_reg-like domain